MKTRIIILAIVACAVIGFSQPASRAQAQRTTNEGVFTDEQADRGAGLIVKIGCGGCHNADLSGGIEETPALIGNSFISDFAGQTLKDLNNQIATMPPDNPNQITPEGRVDIMAFLLRANGFPTGRNELAPDPAILGQIKIVAP